DPAYTPEVVLSEAFTALPGRRVPGEAVSNFLGGYVPEGNHRVRMAAKRHIDKDDLFALLEQFGGSVAGAATLRSPGETPGYRPSYEPLDDDQVAARLTRAIKDVDQAVPDDSRSTLPGYQPKVLVARFDGQWAYPRGRAHSTHILKPQVPARAHRIVDEYYSHELARGLGLAAYGSELRQAGPVTYLAIERYDRVVRGQTVTVTHQEDLAQALGLDWLDSDVKYQEPGWPDDPRRATARRIGTLLGSLPGGGAVVEEWVRQVTYRLAIGDNDAHAKNVALLHEAGGTRLAPVYDAVPNLFQEGLASWNLALAIDGTFDHRRVSIERLLAEVASWGVISAARAADAVTTTLDGLDEALRRVPVPDGVSPGLAEHLHWNVHHLRAGDEIGEPGD
ncbi:MAG: HipA domain-containing protein, partial [Actinomycetia bacterium]|nr:HipA domain-containing protein [Actinomycetes bacterium]